MNQGMELKMTRVDDVPKVKALEEFTGHTLLGLRLIMSDLNVAGREIKRCFVCMIEGLGVVAEEVFAGVVGQYRKAVFEERLGVRFCHLENYTNKYFYY